MDRHQPPVPHRRDVIQDDESHLPHRSAAPQRRPVAGLADVTAMVRSLQRRAGTADCFRRGDAQCDRMDCDWRNHCLDITTDREAPSKK